MEGYYDLSVKCAIIGDTGVGKSSIVSQYATHRFSSDFTPTIGIEFQTKLHKSNNGAIVKYQLWDAGGNERYRKLLNSFINDSLVLVLVYDRNDRSTFENLKYWIKMTYASQINSAGSAGIPLLIIVANKSDTKGVVSDKEGEEFALMNGAKFAKVSAISNKSINTLFTIITEELVKRYNISHTCEDNVQENEDEDSKSHVSAKSHVCVSNNYKITTSSQQTHPHSNMTDKTDKLCCQCNIM
jgi:Ras-related protein Rab-6A